MNIPSAGAKGYYMADYCTTTDVKSNPDVGISSTDVTQYDTVISALITQASRMIDEYLGKWPNYFYPSTDMEIRYYTALDHECIEIDEAVSITEVAVSEGGEVTSTGYTAWAATDYLLWPYNYSASGQPVRRIEVDPLNGSQYSFYGYPKGVRITGIFGFSLTPPVMINRAAVAQTIYMFMQDKAAYQNASAGGNQGSLFYDGKLHPLVQAMLQPYMLKGIV
jgi:hypothetical protein